MSEADTPTGRCTKAAKLRRVDIVYRYLLEGLDSAQVIERVQDDHAAWGVKRRAIEAYIHDARELVIKAGEFERHQEFGCAAAQLRDLYRRALERDDLRAARLIRKDLTELYGLNAPQRVEVTEILSVLDYEIARKRQEVDELERQYALESTPRPGD